MQAPWLCTKRWDSSREDSSAHVRSGVPRGELMDRWRTQISIDLLIRHRKSGKTFLTQYLVDLKTVRMVLVIIVVNMLTDWGDEKWGYTRPWQSWTRRNIRRRFLGLSRNLSPPRCHAIFFPPRGGGRLRDEPIERLNQGSHSQKYWVGCVARFSKPISCLWPKLAIFPTLFMTWPKLVPYLLPVPKPITLFQNIICTNLWRPLADGLFDNDENVASF